MKNIHVLSTDKPSRLYLTTHEYIFEKGYSLSTDECENKHIYITSDEEIENCWFVNLTNNEIGYIKNNIGTQKNAKKIILTTDQDLIKDGVQAIDDRFLEWFVKNPSCENVKVRKNPRVNAIVKGYGVKSFNNGYKIIIPKEEPKQETIEEAAENYGWRIKRNTFSDAVKANELAESAKQDFIAGAKWQAEKMYSKEEVKHLMTLAFEQGFKKADIVEAGLEAKETDTEVNWIFLKHKK